MIQPGLRSILSKSLKTQAMLIRFLIVGVTATLGYVLICYFLQTLSGWQPFWASIVAYATMFLFAYVAQRSFTFRSTRNHRISLPLYAALQIACGLFAATAVQWLVNSAHISALAASATAAALSAAASYLVSASWIFPDAGKTDACDCVK
jgi:putative flippase GtrA